jgi:WD40 repeat protein
MTKVLTSDASAPCVRPERVLQLGHGGDVHSVVFTPDGRRLISGAWDHTLRIWAREAAEGSPQARQRWALLRTLTPQEGVDTVALSPDGAIMASGSSGVTDGRRHGRIVLWDARTAEPLRRLDGHGDSVRHLCFSPDGALLASGSWDGSILLWDTRTWSPRFTLRSGARFSDVLSFSSDGALLASPRSGDAVLIWDARTGELQRRLEVEAGRHGCIDAVAFSPIEPLLAVGVGSGAVFLWDTRKWRLRRTLDGCRSRVFAVAFAPDGKTVAATDLESVLCVWNARSGQQRWRRSVHPRAERRYANDAAHGQVLAFSPDGTQLAVGTGLFEDSIRFFDARTGARAGVLRGHSDAFTAVHFSPDGRTLAASGMPDGTLRFWDTATGALTRTLKRGRDEVWLIGYSPDGEEILSYGGAGRRGVQRWDARTDAWRGTMTAPRLRVCALAFSPDGTVVAAGGTVREGDEYLGRLQLRDARTGKLLRSLRGHRDQVIALAFSPDGRMLASGDGSWCVPGEVRLWETATGRCLRTLTGHLNQVDNVAFSPGGRLLATAGVGPVGEEEPVNSSDVRLWDVGTGYLVRVLPDTENATRPLAFSPDGALLATNGSGADVKLWHPETGALLRTLAGHNRPILDLTFSPDGRRLATTSLDGTVKLWDPHSGMLLATFVILPPEHPRSVSTEWITFTPDGHSVNSEGAARFIRWRVGEELLPWLQ